MTAFIAAFRKEWLTAIRERRELASNIVIAERNLARKQDGHLACLHLL